MKPSDAIILVTLGLLWGVSFLFMRVAVPEFGPFALIGLRVGLAAMILLPLVYLRQHPGELRAHWRSIALIGVLHYAIPFCLYAYAMLTLSAGYSSLVNAAAPIFAAAVARFWLGERLNTSRALGLVMGLAGVGLLVGDKLAAGGGANAVAVGATLLAAICYGLAAVMAKRWLAGVTSTTVAGGSMVAAAIVLLPLTLFLWPHQAPSAGAWGGVVLLGLACTAAAFVMYFKLIDSIGPTRSITVTFLIPLFAVGFGVLFLDEQLTASMLAGGLVIITGTALATGLLQLDMLVRKGRHLLSRIAIVILAVAAIDDVPPDIHVAKLQACDLHQQIVQVPVLRSPDASIGDRTCPQSPRLAGFTLSRA